MICFLLTHIAHHHSTTTSDLKGGDTQGTYFQRLGTQIQGMSNKIHQLTLRGGANFLVCSPQVATIIESIPGYASDTDGNQSQFAMGVSKVGALNNRFQVYKNPYMTSGGVLVGFRGTNFLRTGAVYAPYIPLIQTPLVYDPVFFTPRRGVMTRYAKKMVRPEFYGKISVTNFRRLQSFLSCTELVLVRSITKNLRGVLLNPSFIL